MHRLQQLFNKNHFNVENFIIKKVFAYFLNKYEPYIVEIESLYTREKLVFTY